VTIDPQQTSRTMKAPLLATAPPASLLKAISKVAVKPLRLLAGARTK
jgi:hypothetical protein